MSRELKLQQTVQLPLKLPQRRKFVTLGEADSATCGINVTVENSALVFNKPSSLMESQKTSDLSRPTAESYTVGQMQLKVMAKEEKSSQKVKKDNITVFAIDDLDPRSKAINSSFDGSSNSSRICRVCGKEFPSGRALGGHMRVHGALLFSDSASMNFGLEHEQRNHGEVAGNVGFRDLKGPIEYSCHKDQAEGTKPHSFTSSSSFVQITSEKLPHDDLAYKCQDGEDSYEEDNEKVSRMVNLSSLECSSMVSKPSRELLDEALPDGKNGLTAAYELRRNPKPNRRFIGDQEPGLPISNCLSGPQIGSAANHARRSPSPSPEQAFPCSECGKVFSSWKALFGHMRCHPERDWRGIQPPGHSILELIHTAHRSISHKSILPKVSSAEENAIAIASDTSTHVNVRYTTIKKQDSLSDDKDSLAPLANLAAESLGKKTDVMTTKVEGGSEEHRKMEYKVKRHRHTKRAADIQIAAWPPSWPSTGKRSKRNFRHGPSLNDHSLTSEATSNTVKLSQTSPQLMEAQEDLDMANCLVLLSGAKDNMLKKEPVFSYHGRPFRNGTAWKSSIKNGAVVYGTHWDNEDDHPNDHHDVQNKVNSFACSREAEHSNGRATWRLNTEAKYQCSTCKKCFNSHQALGGHRASHRKTKGCFVQMKNYEREPSESSEENLENIDDLGTQLGTKEVINQQIRMQDVETAPIPLPKPSLKKKFKGHECSICHRVFASGQALGGHKRCHWNSERYTPDAVSVASTNHNNNSSKQSSLEEKPEWGCRSSSTMQEAKMVKEDTIDLNLPAPLDEDDGMSTDQDHIFDGLTPCTAGTGRVIIDSMVDSFAGSSRKDVGEGNWMVKDLLGTNGGSSFLQATREVEAIRSRFDRRPPMWSQRWDDAVVAQTPQICTVQPL